MRKIKINRDPAIHCQIMLMWFTIALFCWANVFDAAARALNIIALVPLFGAVTLHILLARKP
jgi:hypothetical protein